MTHVYYLGLEPYKERYTELLTKWTIDRLEARKVSHTYVPGVARDNTIKTGRVLDAHGRCHWGLTQMAALVLCLQEDTERDIAIYLDDLFTPGYEALPYILDQMHGHHVRVYARNHAQSVDPDDFTFAMRRWMRPFEQMAYATLTGVICASSVHRELMEIAMLRTDHVHVLGLPYDTHDVRSRGPEYVEPFCMKRPMQVIYASRFDSEKQPLFFLAIVNAMKTRCPAAEFVLCTGSAMVRSNDLMALMELEDARKAGRVRVVTNATKLQYYTELANSRVQLNTARQDFISYTAIEASTFGTPTLAPAFRSFPEALRNRASQLYTPWSVEDACDKLVALLYNEEPASEIATLAEDQHTTLDLIIDLMVLGR